MKCEHADVIYASADRRAITSSALLLAGLMTVTACGSLTPGQRDEREYRRVQFEDRFIDFRQQCRASGGRIVIDAKQGLRRGDIPRRGDRYVCS